MSVELSDLERLGRDVLVVIAYCADSNSKQTPRSIAMEQKCPNLLILKLPKFN